MELPGSIVACLTMNEVLPPECTVTFAVMSADVTFDIVKPITVDCTPMPDAYTLTAAVPIAWTKLFLKLFAMYNLLNNLFIRVQLRMPENLL
jgi:hypothetical protein